MKFTVLYKHNDEVKKYYMEKRGTRYGDNIDLVGLKTVEIIDKKTKEVACKAYAFLCKGSVVDYIRHKMKYGKFAKHCIGWKEGSSPA